MHLQLRVSLNIVKCTRTGREHTLSLCCCVPRRRYVLQLKLTRWNLTTNETPKNIAKCMRKGKNSRTKTHTWNIGDIKSVWIGPRCCRHRCRRRRRFDEEKKVWPLQMCILVSILENSETRAKTPNAQKKMKIMLHKNTQDVFNVRAYIV